MACSRGLRHIPVRLSQSVDRCLQLSCNERQTAAARERWGTSDLREFVGEAERVLVPELDPLQLQTLERMAALEPAATVLLHPTHTAAAAAAVAPATKVCRQPPL
jgi:hypothetical protein